MNHAAEPYFKPAHTFLVHKLPCNILVKQTDTGSRREDQEPITQNRLFNPAAVMG